MLTHVSAMTSQLGTGQKELHGHAYDISESGVRIELDHALEVGESVNLSVELPWAGPQIQGPAKVVWVNDEQDDPGPRRMALRFGQLKSIEQTHQLSRFIEGGLVRAAA
jgi:Tfp pilus assembly protein PilZ